LAAVDNGVLQVSDFATPDPYAEFYAKRALAVNAYDLYPLLFPEIKTTRSSTGGDAEKSMDQRVNPMQNKRIKMDRNPGGSYLWFKLRTKSPCRSVRKFRCSG